MTTPEKPDNADRGLEQAEVVLDGTMEDVLGQLERKEAAQFLGELLDTQKLTGVSVLDTPINRNAMYRLIEATFSELAPEDPFSDTIALPPITKDQLRPFAAQLIALLTSARILNPNAKVAEDPDAPEIGSGVRTKVFDVTDEAARRRAQNEEVLDASAATVVEQIFHRDKQQ